MGWHLVSPLLFFFLFAYFSVIKCQDDPYFLGYKCGNVNGKSSGNYTQDSPFHSNLLSALANLTSLSSSHKFSNFTVGTNEDATNQVYALYDCRLDLTLQTCHDCVKDVSTSLLQTCPNPKEAVAWYKECMLRYANRPLFAVMEIVPYYFICDVSIPDGGELTRVAGPILKRLIEEATSENSSSYFAVGEGTYFEYQKVYCLVQCTPDISRAQCKECLDGGLNDTLHQCTDDARLTGIYYVPSCQLRYDIVPFYNISSNLGLPPMASPHNMSPQPKTNDGVQRIISLKYIVLLFIFLSLYDVIILSRM